MNLRDELATDCGHWQGRRVMITGAGGFIGRALVRRLCAGNAEVHAISRVRRVAEPGVHWHAIDLTDHGALDSVVRTVRPQSIFHLAAMVTGSRNLDDVLPVMHNNLTSSVNLLVAATQHSDAQVVLAGSIEEPKTIDSQVTASSPYALTKWAVTNYVDLFARLYETRATVLRIAMVYGPGAQTASRLIPYVITSLIEGTTPRLTGGTRHVDWIYIDDVVDALVASGEQEAASGRAFDIASGIQTSIRATVELIIELMDSPIVPDFGALADRRFDRDQRASFADAADTLGWRPKTPLAAGLQRTIDWHREINGSGANY